MADDDAEVLKAIRLGWALAEVSGRNRLDAPPDVGDATHETFVDASTALHLRSERTPAERCVEAQAVLQSIADAVCPDATGGTCTLAKKALDAAAKLAEWRAQKQPDDALKTQWNDLHQCIQAFDTHVQDVLSGKSERQACGYQLGRGLAESYWASTTKKDGDVTQVVAPMLDAARCDELGRLAGRVGPVLPEYTPCVIAGSLEIWKAVVTDPATQPGIATRKKRSWAAHPDTGNALYKQQRRWFEMLVTGQSPTTLVRPFAVLKTVRATGAALRAFALQIIGLAVSLAALGGFAWLLSSGHDSPLLKTALGVIGALGLSTTTIQTKVKSSSQALVKRLREDAYTDLIVLETTVVPPRDPDDAKHRVSDPTDRAKAAALRNRRLSTAVSV